MRYLAARLIDRLPDRVKIRLSRRAPIVIDGQTLDPQVQFLQSMRRAPGLCEPTIERGRARYRRETMNFRGPVTEVRRVRDLSVAPPPSAASRHTLLATPRTLRVRLYESEPDAPLTVYFHGGGFVIGDLDTHDEPCRILCKYARTHVLSVEYRCAPEHPFPAGLEDAAKAYAWARANASRVAVAGDSAGANFAAVIAHETRTPIAQLLIYPAVDARTRRRSHELFGEGFFLTNRDRDAFEANYAGDDADPRVSPLFFDDFTNLPPALVVLASFDILRDEGEAYAQKLPSARVLRFPTLGHGFIHLTGVSRTAREAMIAIAKEWGRMLS